MTHRCLETRLPVRAPSPAEPHRSPPDADVYRQPAVPAPAQSIGRTTGPCHCQHDIVFTHFVQPLAMLTGRHHLAKLKRQLVGTDSFFRRAGDVSPLIGRLHNREIRGLTVPRSPISATFHFTKRTETLFTQGLPGVRTCGSTPVSRWSSPWKRYENLS